MQPTAVYNPSTKEVRFLPNPNEAGRKQVQSSLDNISSSRKANKVLVLTLGIDKSWRDTQNIFPCVLYFMPSVCTSGAIYKFAMADYISIVAFDVKSEKIKIIALWNGIEFVYYYHLIEVKGKLGIIDYRKWTPKREWERHIIGVPSIWNTTQHRFASFFMARDGEIVFVVNLKSGDLCCLFCDDTRKSWMELKLKGLPKMTSKAFIVMLKVSFPLGNFV
ncbi:hypothetical protein H5410_003929 [Solanum commersonii]|uniref:F-box associated beta-propeller type 3 domain-containing protein n=1 Tax=Solanum commersonii TaxID=4109 RepID=A0A9J6B6L9_SOLCO|nr:hypothetical protein H5410_003929 [Solanum commersonii]